MGIIGSVCDGSNASAKSTENFWDQVNKLCVQRVQRREDTIT